MAALDTALIERWTRLGDADAFNELVRRHAGMVYGTCLRIVCDHHAAEDVAQECLLEMARKAASVRDSVPAFLHTTAISRSQDRRRQDHARQRREQIAADGQPREEQAAEPTWAELSPRIDEAIARLPEEQRLPLVLHFLGGRSQVEVAEALGCDQATVSRRINRGIEGLRRLLGQRGLCPSLTGLGLLLGSQAAVAAPASVLAAGGRMAAAGIGVPAAATFTAGKLTAVLLIGTALALPLAHSLRTPAPTVAPAAPWFRRSGTDAPETFRAIPARHRFDIVNMGPAHVMLLFEPTEALCVSPRVVRLAPGARQRAELSATAIGTFSLSYAVARADAPFQYHGDSYRAANDGETVAFLPVSPEAFAAVRARTAAIFRANMVPLTDPAMPMC